MKINSYILFAMLSIFVMPAFPNLSQNQETNQNKHFKSIACDYSGAHCLGLSHNPEEKYSLMLYRTDNSGESWYRLNTEFYRRIGSDEKLDGSEKMEIACDQYLQNCLIGVTILHGQGFVFYGTNDGGQIWKGTIIWHEPTKTLQSSYIVQLTCNSSTGSQCHLLTDTNDIYILENQSSDSGTTGTDTLDLTMHPLSSH